MAKADFFRHTLAMNDPFSILPYMLGIIAALALVVGLRGIFTEVPSVSAT